ncbi:toll/interleukin-1 receptor domain-containing protein [Micromonospora arida]|uniref:toll/interleukin-1 receptor domain-containing protein n=1 Tax=Micromonospora arida TaxID=2203715 RepID=UPI0033DF881A
MKIFISWSGEPSRQVARALRDWLSVVAQHVELWMSEEEIQSGTRWNDSIASSLDVTNFGIVCVTRANQSAPWLMFEAGALAKRLEQARVVPLCIDLEPSDITSPLHAFQGRKLDRAGMRRLVNELSDLAENPRPRESIDTLFDAMWPRLEAAVAEATATITAPSGEPNRSAESMLAELVTRVRNIERDTENRESHQMETRLLGERVEKMQIALFSAKREAEEAVARAHVAMNDHHHADARTAAALTEVQLLQATVAKLRHELEAAEGSNRVKIKQGAIRSPATPESRAAPGHLPPTTTPGNRPQTAP